MGFAWGIAAEGKGGTVASLPIVIVGGQVRTLVHAAVLVQTTDVLRIVIIRGVVKRRNVSVERLKNIFQLCHEFPKYSK